MKLSFLSNYYTHHQKPLCTAWYGLTEKSFSFVETETMPEERIKLGWAMDSDAEYVVGADKITDDIINADTLILGNAPMSAVIPRLNKNKTVFKYSERVFKKGYSRIKWLPRLYTYHRNYGKYKSLYLLAASAYASGDFAMHGVFKNKSYKWGYFPQTKHYDVKTLLENKEQKKILWCGRLIDWKHPEVAIKLAKKLKSEGISFSLDIIGTGALEQSIAASIKENGLQDCVKLLGAMKPEEVRQYMEKTELFLFTSDFNEGWGAVLNEAMNSACATVASHAAGATPFLVKHGENGLIYKNGDFDDLYIKTKALLQNDEKRRALSENAYHTIIDLWNANLAAKRFLRLAEEIKKHGTCDLYEDGPCSKAPALKNNWFKEEDYDIPWIAN